jgi:hypothetical protein
VRLNPEHGINKRVGDVFQPGTYWIAPSPALAKTLVEDIKSLVP